MLIVRSPVRVSFGGGGTDLPGYYEHFGGAVLSAAINKYFYTVLGKRSDGRIQIISSDLRVFESWRDIREMSIRGSKLEIPLAVLKDLDCEVSVDLFLASEIPPGTGLGSSASVCVNMLKTLTSYTQIPFSKYDLAERAFYIARDVLGKHVGKQDEYAASFGGLNFITFHRDGSTLVERLELPPASLEELRSNLALFFTGTAHESWAILKEQEESTKPRSGTAVEALHELRSLADQMRAALEKGALHEFGILLDEGWQFKKKISDKISSSRIDELYQLARAEGAIGGKITGAGGGGFLLLYCEPGCRQAVHDALESQGVREMGFDFDQNGTQVIVNDPFIDGDDRAGSRWVFVPALSEPAPSEAGDHVAELVGSWKP